jgi:hypothetical protein
VVVGVVSMTNAKESICFAVLVILILVGCSKERVTLKYPAIIDKAGTLESADGTLLAKIEIIDEIINITILDKATEDTLLKVQSGNVYHRWYLSWDKEGRLWNWNSDIGGDVFEVKDGKWISNKKPDYRKAPHAFVENLPSTIKRRLK